MIPQWVKNKEKLTNYLVNVSDSKFDNVTQIIGNGFENSKAYLITNRPIGEGNYIQNGRRQRNHNKHKERVYYYNLHNTPNRAIYFLH